VILKHQFWFVDDSNRLQFLLSTEIMRLEFEAFSFLLVSGMTEMLELVVLFLIREVYY